MLYLVAVLTLVLILRKRRKQLNRVGTHAEHMPATSFSATDHAAIAKQGQSDKSVVAVVAQG